MPEGRVQLQRVSHSFRRGSSVFADVDLAVEPGDIVAVNGRNGAGKSTLLRIAAGVMRPRSGHVTHCGRIALLPQNADSPPPGMSALTWLAAVTRMHGKGSTDDAVELLDALAVATPARRLDELSVGTARKAMLAAALTGHPDVLVLDEPFAALDVVAAASASALIKAAAADGAAVLVSDHDGAAARIATHTLNLARMALEPADQAAPPTSWRIVAAGPAGNVRELVASETDRDAVLLRLLNDGERVLRVEELE